MQIENLFEMRCFGNAFFTVKEITFFTVILLSFFCFDDIIWNDRLSTFGDLT